MLRASDRLIHRHLTRECRQARRAGDTAKVEKLEWLFANGEAYAMATEQICRSAGYDESDLEVIFFGDREFPMLDGLKGLLDWVVENWDEIAKIIEYLMKIWVS